LANMLDVPNSIIALAMKITGLTVLMVYLALSTLGLVYIKIKVAHYSFSRAATAPQPSWRSLHAAGILP
jgi:hypothetical protein